MKKQIKKIAGSIMLSILCVVTAFAQENYNGINANMGNISRLSNARSRSISAENFTGEKGKGGMATEGTGKHAARDLGLGWKISPYIIIKPHTTFTLAEINGSGCIQHIWMTPTGNWRNSIIRMYWDGETTPSVECPVGYFFGMAWGKFAQLTSLAVCVNPGSAFNCYWPMPFRKNCKITIENIDDREMWLYYQIDYIETSVPADEAYFHAQFRRTNPIPYKSVYTVIDGIKGKGQYVGTFLAIGVRGNGGGWLGEGEIKFYMDGDKEFPTICGTGLEDYFCGSYNWGVDGKFREYSTAYSGMHQFLRGEEYQSNASQRFSMYRWHIQDPVRFEKDLKITLQALGWRSGYRYLPLQDDYSSVAYWYQTEPHAAFPQFPDRDALEFN